MAVPQGRRVSHHANARAFCQGGALRHAERRPLAGSGSGQATEEPFTTKVTKDTKGMTVGADRRSAPKTQPGLVRALRDLSGARFFRCPYPSPAFGSRFSVLEPPQAASFVVRALSDVLLQARLSALGSLAAAGGAQ